MPNNWRSLIRLKIRTLTGYPIVRRLVSGTAANFLSKFWVLIVQLLLIPILTHKWGIEGYGVWLMISTIPTYIALADLGMGAAVGVEITKKVACGDYRGALKAFQSVWVALTGIVIIVIVIVIIFAISVYTSGNGVTGGFSNQDLAIAIVLISIYSGFIAQMTFLSLIFAATHKYALGTFLKDILFPVEGAAIITIAWLGGEIFEVALILLIIRITGWTTFRLILKAKEPWLLLGYQQASWTVLRPLLHPSLAVLALTFSNAIILQGVILTIGWVAGPATVAIYGAARMLTRIPLQFASLVWRASIPELTRSQTSNNTLLTKRLLTVNIGFAIITTLPFIPIFWFFGSDILLFVSNNKLQLSTSIFMIMAIAALLNATWSASASAMFANNQQTKFSYYYLLFSLFPLLAPFLPFQDKILIVAIAALLAELFIQIIVVLLLKSNKISK